MISLDWATPDEWEEIQGFRSGIEFTQFEEWIAGAVEEGVIREVPVTSHYGGSSFDEHWYRTSNGVVWRLVDPDPPFPGVFERVPAQDL